MTAVCICFEVHQPYRLRRYSVFDTNHQYFDDDRNAEILTRVARKSYLPATQLLRDLVVQHQGRFRLGLSLTGVVVEQLKTWCPEALAGFKALVATGHVELLSETYYHSLAGLYSRDEFAEQVALHRAMVEREFGQAPRIFRNTELIYSNELARFAAQMGYRGILAEGVDRLLGKHPPGMTRHPPLCPQIGVLLRNYRRSDDLAFRFGDRTWSGWPLHADQFAATLRHGDGPLCNLFMDFEVLGEHQWAETGIFEFFRHLPTDVLADGLSHFVTPSEALERFPSAGEWDVPQWISWADSQRDLSAWLGNGMQVDAARQAYNLEKRIKASGDADLLRDWRRLTISDHFYYMSTKTFGDGVVHKYFNPYQSAYDSYINYMNVLDSFTQRLDG